MIFEFKFPDVGEGVHEGKILQLKFNPGDTVAEGDVLAIVETDKVVAEIPTSASGTLLEYGVAEGQIIHVGETLAKIKTGESGVINTDEPRTKVPIEEDNAGVVGELETAGSFVLPATGEGLEDSSTDSIALTSNSRKVLASPVARKLAADLGIDINSIKGSGPAGRVMKNDIQEAKHTNEASRLPLSSSPSPSGAVTSHPLSTLRQTIARNMAASWEIPGVVIHDFCVIDDLYAMRQQINEGQKERISFQPFFMKAAAAALKLHPMVNASFDSQNFTLNLHQDVNMGFAFQTKDGLTVPVIHNITEQSIREVNNSMRQLVNRGNEGNFAVSDLRGGTFTITNYGAFAGVYGRPMILPPQVAILGLGRIHEAPVVKNGEVIAAKVLPISLVFDHRALDGAPAAAFLADFMSLLTSPGKLLVSL